MRSGRRAVSTLVLLFLAVFVFAQGSEGGPAEDPLAGLFDEGGADVESPESGADHRAAFEDLGGIRLSGSYALTGGLGIGLREKPAGAAWTDVIDPSVGLSAASTLSLDARPFEDFRFHVDANLSATGFSALALFVNPSIGAIYADYTWLGRYFVRAGQFTTTWGQGRLFTPGNLMRDGASGYALRLEAPTLLSGATLLVLTQPAWIAATTPSWKQLAYAGGLDLVLGGILLGGNLRYRAAEGFSLRLGAKAVIFATDFFLDGVGRLDLAGTPAFSGVAGFYREFSDLKCYGEVYAEGGAGGLEVSRSGLVASLRRIFGSQASLSAQWLQDWTDLSGSLTLGLSTPAWHLVTLKVGLPWTWGGAEGYYVLNNPDPDKRRFAAGIVLELAASF